MGNGLFEDSPANNEISTEPNKIHFTRHNWDESSDDSSEDDSEEDSCPECFEDMGEGIIQEYGHKHHKKSGHNYSKYPNRDDIINSKHHKSKHGYGETIMSDQPINSEYGHGGRTSLGGRDQQRRRTFSFNTDDLRKSPTTRHYETKGHNSHHKHKSSYSYDDDDDEEQEQDDNEYFYDEQDEDDFDQDFKHKYSDPFE